MSMCLDTSGGLRARSPKDFHSVAVPAVMGKASYLVALGTPHHHLNISAAKGLPNQPGQCHESSQSF